MFRKKLREQAGFTLIEMLIVVILLGILAMLIVPQISVSTDDARLNSMHSNLGALRNAIELYYYEHDRLLNWDKKSTKPRVINLIVGQGIDHVRKY